MKRLMRFRLVQAVAALCLVAAICGAVFAASAPDAKSPKPAAPKNVIIMISDGCGMNSIRAADYYTYGTTGRQPYETFPVRTFASTYSADGSGYDGDRNWQDFKSPRSGATDSAAAATAMATGVKTYDSAIGVGPDKKPLRNVLERAEELGKSTGVITTVPFSHATPAGFVAHNASRDEYVQIAAEMLERSSADVIMGCGSPLFDKDGKPLAATAGSSDEAERYQYVGGREEWEKLDAGKAGAAVDADHNGKLDDNWTLVQTRDEFRGLMTGKTPKRVVAVAQVAETLQERRSGHDANIKDDAPYETPLIETVPTLSEMTSGALNVLDDNPKGLFLMIEGGAIDWANHSNQEGRMIEEETAFNDAVKTVVDWVNANSSWDETLLIVTADHETGYITANIESSGESVRAYDDFPATEKGALPCMKYNSGGHTNNLVPLFANGAAAPQLLTYPNGTDPHYGQYIDNTAIAKTVFEAWKDK